MSVLIKQIFVTVLLVGLIAGVRVLEKLSRPATGGTTRLSPKEALESYGFYLEEVAKENGIDFKHEAPTLDHKLDKVMPIVNAMTASVSVVDFDRDGWPDLYVTNSGEGTKNHLYRNLGVDKSGKPRGFKDVAEELGVADLNRPGTGVCTGAVWGDFDNDGYEDLLVYKWGRPELYRNLGKDKNGKHRGFERVKDCGLPSWVNTNSAIWFDYNRDGNLDLFIAGYWSEDLDLWHLETTRVMPNSFKNATNGGRKYVLRNRGKDPKTGRWLGFEDVTRQMGIRLNDRRWTLAVGAADLCGTGYPDLFLANDYSTSQVYANHGGKKFVEISGDSGITKEPKSGMNVSFGDIYNNGLLAVYVSNITEPKLLLQYNNLWVPKPGKSGDDLEFTNLADQLGIGQAGWSWCAQFGDFNNDGLLDIYLVNGYISGDRNDNYWFRYSKIAGANKGVIIDAENWSRIGNLSLSGYQQKCLWINQGTGFLDVAQAVGPDDLYDGRAVALVDLWNRGVLDVVVANQKGPLLLYKNTVVKDNQWIQFELTGKKSNRSAIGAQVRVFWNGQQQVQEVSGGIGYASQNMRRLHFGLGKDPQMENVIIRWPSDKTESLGALKAGKCYKLREPK
jgi:hypothetical protein